MSALNLLLITKQASDVLCSVLHTPSTSTVHGCCAKKGAHLLEKGVAHAHVIARIPARAVVLGVNCRASGHPGRLTLRTLLASSRLLACSNTHLSMSHKASDLRSLLLF